MPIYYLDNNRGSDLNDGLTPQTAWKNPNKINSVAVAVAGTQFLFASDSHWQMGLNTSERVVPPTTWLGTESNPVVFGRYHPSSASSTSRPLFSKFIDIPAESWSYSSVNNCWVFDAGADVGNLCYVKIADTWMASRIDRGLPLDSIAGRYHNSGNLFYLWSPSGTNPTAYYGKVRLGISSGIFVISSARKWIKIQGLEFKDIGVGIFGYSNNAGNMTGLVVEDIKASSCSNPITTMAQTAGAFRVIVRGCEVYDFGSTGITSFTPDGLGYAQLEIHNNLLYDGVKTYSQGAIYVQVRSPGCRPQIYRNNIHSINYGTPNKEADGSAIYCETGSDAVDVYCNRVWNCHLALQDNSGRSSTWRSNLILGCKSAMGVTDEQRINSINHTFEGNTCFVGADVNQAHGVGTSFRGWRHYAHEPASAQSSVYRIRNNVFVNLQQASPGASVNESTPSTAIYAAETPAAWTGVLDNNATVGFDRPAAYQYAGGSIPTAGWISVDPKIDVNGRPLSGSPLIQAGIHTGYFRDFLGRQRPNPPSIGAYDVIEFS